MKKLSTSCEHTCFLFHMHYIDWPVSLLGLLPLQMGDIRQFSFLENSMASAAGIRRFNHHCHSVTDENRWLSRATLNKVIGRKPASPPSTDRPIAFASWRQSLPPHVIHGSLDQHESATKRHLDRSSRSAQPTHVFSTPTTLRAMSVAIARIEHCAQLAMPAKSQHSLMTYDIW